MTKVLLTLDYSIKLRQYEESVKKELLHSAIFASFFYECKSPSTTFRYCRF